ncbi:MAG TPA: hypothetical protein VMK83_07690 [Gaiellaceae bacterium]|nr:hypothetical protein [Gaiellaceae bacterium]
MLVASVDDVLATKLVAMTAGARLARDPRSRALCAGAGRWNDVEVRTKSSAFARAFFTLGEGLGIIERTVVLAAVES